MISMTVARYAIVADRLLRAYWLTYYIDIIHHKNILFNNPAYFLLLFIRYDEYVSILISIGELKVI